MSSVYMSNTYMYSRSLREVTLAVLGDSEAVEQLAEAHGVCVDGDSVRGVEAVRALRLS